MLSRLRSVACRVQAHSVRLFALRGRDSWQKDSGSLGGDVGALKTESAAGFEDIDVFDTMGGFERMNWAMAASAAPKKVESILLLSNCFNSMSQRLWLHLLEQGYRVHFESVDSEQDIQRIYDEKVVDAAGGYNFDAVICPFLTKKVPKAVFFGKPDEAPKVLIVHPGIKGDRGLSSIEWCLLDKDGSPSPRWGVTVVEAHEDMDCGDIWSSKNFSLARDGSHCALTKSNLYQKEIVGAAVECIDEALYKMKHRIAPEPLDYDDPTVEGTLRPTMKVEDRRIEWSWNGDTICDIINAVTSRPGAVATIEGVEYLVFGAKIERNLYQNSIEMVEPGTPLFSKDDAVLISTATTPVWVAALRKRGKGGIKLPAALVLEGADSNLKPERGFKKLGPWHPIEAPLASSYSDVFYEIHDGAVYVHFDFLNGAMDTRKCNRLQAVLQEVSSLRERVVVLLGGYQYFANGINLNTIEHADDPQLESFRNIEAMNDVIQTLCSCFTDKLLISAVQGNCGAGGCMLALVGDVVLSHHSVVFNPHYKLMALKGSEYWTYFLPQRVGHAAAEKLTALALPLSAAMAKSLGVVDEILGADTEEFRGRLRERVRGIANEPSLSARLLRKSRERSNLEWMRTTKRHRDYEMMEMLNNFESAEYHQKRHDFVHKVYAKTVVEWQQAQSLLALLNQWGCHGAAAAESLPRIAHSAEVAPAAECGAKAESG